MGLSAAGGDIDPGMSPSRQLAGNRRTRRCLQRDGTGLIVRPLRHLLQLQPRHVRPHDTRGLPSRAAEHHRHAPLRVVAGGIVVAADLLARRRIPFQVFRWCHPSRTGISYLP